MKEATFTMMKQDIEAAKDCTSNDLKQSSVLSKDEVGKQ